MERLKIELSPQQMEFMRHPKKNVVFCGGLGSGKTFSGAVWAAKMALTYQDCAGFITANSYKQLRSATLPEFFKQLDSLGVPYRYYKNDGEIHIGNAKIYCVSMENYDLLRGVEVGWAWSDECAFYDHNAFKVLIARIRDKRGPCLWRGTTTPNGYNWVYENFYASPGESTGIVFASTHTNRANLSDDYIQTLEEQYDSRLIAQELDGRFVNLNSGKAYHAFDREKHLEHRIPSRSIVYVGLDFNVHPLCGIFCFEDQGKIFVFDELWQEHSNTFKAAKEIVSRYNPAYLRVVADDSGAKRKTNSAKTDYQILKEVGLEVMGFRNPLIKDRVNNINRHFEHGNLFISPNCERLISDLEKMSLDNKDGMLSHISDALGYAVWYMRPMREARREASVSYR